MTDPNIIPKRPYLLRAMHEWMSDNGLTPHIVVDALREGVDVPQQHVQNGKIILNASYAATEGLQLGNEHVMFSARFGGVAHNVCVPVDAVMGIYARESGQGMIFTEEEPDPDLVRQDDDQGDDDHEPPGRSHLKVVK